uniref:ATP-grasp domain-containing protein n=1 Tax=Pedobacter schmidteae TaxID=2201271 RepID=UPI0013CF31BF|nr:hypothetical protein [Pedobacter schmidteae]
MTDRLGLLKSACVKNDIHFVSLDQATVDFSDLPVPTENDGLYNCSRGSMLLERCMLNLKVRTFYREFPGVGLTENSNHWSILHKMYNISMPKTVFNGTNDKALLKKYVDFLAGFPLVLKTYGGTGGVGVIKVDNYATLFSVCDYFTENRIEFALKEFIPAETCERLTVVGDQVVAGICRPIVADDFRSNAFDTKTFSKRYGPEVTGLAIKAVQCSNFNLGGVDIVVDKRTGVPHVLEVNFPLNFVHSEIVTGVSISNDMVTYLFR